MSAEPIDSLTVNYRSVMWKQSNENFQELLLLKLEISLRSNLGDMLFNLLVPGSISNMIKTSKVLVNTCYWVYCPFVLCISGEGYFI